MRPSLSISSLSPWTNLWPRLTRASELKSPPALAHRLAGDRLVLRWHDTSPFPSRPPPGRPGALAEGICERSRRAGRIPSHHAWRLGQQKTPPSWSPEAGSVGSWSRTLVLGCVQLTAAPSEPNLGAFILFGFRATPRRAIDGRTPSATAACAVAVPGIAFRNARMIEPAADAEMKTIRATLAGAGIYSNRRRPSRTMINRVEIPMVLMPA